MLYPSPLALQRAPGKNPKEKQHPQKNMNKENVWCFKTWSFVRIGFALEGRRRTLIPFSANALKAVLR